MKVIALSGLLMLAVSATGQPLKVMTYNIRLDLSSDGANQWDKRKAKLFALIKKYDPDVFGVQEALPSQMDDLAEEFPEYKYVGVGRDDGKSKGEFSAIFYKTEKLHFLEGSTFWLSETPEIPGSKSWDAAITRIATWGKFKDLSSSKTIVLINTHFDHIGKVAREKSAGLLKQKLTAVAKDLPAIVMGDFNCTRDERPYQVMLEKSSPRLDDPAPKNPAGTFCGFVVNGMACKPIDYLFYTRHWKADAYTVISDNDGQFYPSDHLPVMTTFVLR